MKDLAIQQVINDFLGAHIEVVNLDTDTLGTFTGEIERKDSPLNTVKKKCQWGLDQTNSELGIASEGSFGPHPHIPFCAANCEILYLIDRRHNFELSVSTFTENTNYNSKLVFSMDELMSFAYKVGFPNHGLILNDNKKLIVKGITDENILVDQYYKMYLANSEAGVTVQTDMRAHMNPTRMSVIRLTAEKLCKRLLSLCPDCECPGWGPVNTITGLECSRCGQETDHIKAEVDGCPRCAYQETTSFDTEELDWWYCKSCNP